MIILGNACTGNAPPPTRPSSHSNARFFGGFAEREVLASSVEGNGELKTVPFTTGVIRSNDPYRQNTDFSEAPPDTSGKLVTFEDRNHDGFFSPTSDVKYRLGAALITSADVQMATAVQVSPTAVSSGAWQVEFLLTAEGARKFTELTTRLIGRQVAIVLNGVVVSAPRILSAIIGGQGVITGEFMREQAEGIAAAMKAAT